MYSQRDEKNSIVKAMLYFGLTLYVALSLFIYIYMKLNKLSFIRPLSICIINFLSILFVMWYIKDIKGVLKYFSMTILSTILIGNIIGSSYIIWWSVFFNPTDKKIYSSPMYTNAIVVEKKKLFMGGTNIDIYKVEWGVFKKEIALQLSGNGLAVKWINEEVVEVKVDGHLNYINLNEY